MELFLVKPKRLEIKMLGDIFWPIHSVLADTFGDFNGSPEFAQIHATAIELLGPYVGSPLA